MAELELDVRQTTKDSNRRKKKTFFSLRDYVWSHDQLDLGPGKISSDKVSTEEMLKYIPKIIATEFQPDFYHNYGEQVQQILEKLGKDIGIQDFIERVSDTAIGPIAKFSAKKVSIEALDRVVREAGAANNLFQEWIIDVPINELIKTVFRGKYLYQFEFPFSRDDYIIANGANGWVSTGSEAVIGKQEIVKEIIPLNFPGTPEWSLSSERENPPIEVDMDLYNRDLAALIQNFNFLHTLIPGAFWTQLKTFVKCPNLYDIHCPGRFHYWFCTFKITVTYKGKNRGLGSSYKDFKSGTATELPEDASFPDAYSVKMIFTDLMPSNFNTYAHYLFKGADIRNELQKNSGAFSEGIKRSSITTKTVITNIIPN